MEWKYTKENPLRVVTLCSGYDSQCLALKYSGIPFDLVAWAEFDPTSNQPLEKQPAVIAHNALFPEFSDRNLGDMTKIDWEKVPDFDLLFYSTPCFVAGTLVLTSDGYKPIEEIKVGDMVITHTNSFKKVTAVGKKPYSGNMVKIYGMGTDIIYCTEDHPFYVRRMYKKGHVIERCFHEPEWIKAKNLDKNCYLGYAINQIEKIPTWSYEQNKWEKGKHHVRITDLIANKDFWYIMGRYVGDGWKRGHVGSPGIVIACSDRNKESLFDKLDVCGFHYHITHEGTVIKVHISHKELSCFVDRYGYYAGGKCIDSETINLPKDYLRSFLNGYIDSDGSRVGEIIKTCSISRTLCFGIAHCVAKVYQRPFAIYRTSRPETTNIEGRVVNQKDSYNVVWKETNDKQDKAFYEDGYIWYPLSKLPIIQEDSVMVYNMSVEDDESYTANGAIVHNCQSISNAGLQHGFVEGSGTRSSIIWNVRDAVKVKRPKYLILENVKAMISAKFVDLFNLWQAELEKFGYTNWPAVLNAKDFGCPQNRERIFVVSILDGDWYNFPQPQELKLKLKDMLEEKVDEKYYLDDRKVADFIGQLEKSKIDKICEP